MRKVSSAPTNSFAGKEVHRAWRMELDIPQILKCTAHLWSCSPTKDISTPALVWALDECCICVNKYILLLCREKGSGSKIYNHNSLPDKCHMRENSLMQAWKQQHTLLVSITSHSFTLYPVLFRLSSFYSSLAVTSTGLEGFNPSSPQPASLNYKYSAPLWVLSVERGGGVVRI